MSLPLDGIRVIDFTHVLAGPACAYHLALLGAEVIKLEKPGRGDAMRHRSGTDPERAAQGMSTAYLTQAAGKRSITLDLERDGDRRILFDLLDDTDVLVENHRPSTLRRLGLVDLTERFPRLIHCAMTGYGRGHRHADAPAYDVNIQAASGLMALTGTETSGPMRVGAPVIDYATALAAGFGICAALVERARTGRGRFVDVAMMDVAFTLMSSTIVDHALTGNLPQRRGNAANSRSPSSGVFRCKSGALSLGVNEEAQFARLATALACDDWLTDPRFCSAVARGAHGAALGQEIEAALADRSAEAWEALLLAAGVPAARLREVPDAIAEGAANGRAFLAGPAENPTPRGPFRICDTPATLSPPETLGQSNATILGNRS
ncbi:MAG: CoA transferase [Pseudomonadota bacterium]